MWEESLVAITDIPKSWRRYTPRDWFVYAVYGHTSLNSEKRRENETWCVNDQTPLNSDEKMPGV